MSLKSLKKTSIHKCYNKSYYLYIMQQTYRARITKIGNSKGVRLPKVLALSLGTTEVTLEKTVEGILIKPAPAIPPLSEWAAIFAAADTSTEPELNDWDITLQDGLEDE
jgi:antitoxin component of MazEF toxin-antitoxin module